MRKYQKQISVRIGFTFILILILLTGISVSYSRWSATVEIPGSITTLDDYDYYCLRGHWPMDEGSGSIISDVSGYENDGVLYGEPNWTSGQINGALWFNGTDNYIDCGSVLDVTNKLTIMAWVKDSGNSGGNVIGKYEAANKRWHIYINSGFDDLIYWNVGGVNFGTSPTSAIGTDWHHLAMVFDGTKTGNANRLKAYIDGSEITLTYTGTIPDTMPAISGNVNIGRHGASNFFEGILDDVKIYACALTAGAIAHEAGI